MIRSISAIAAIMLSIGIASAQIEIPDVMTLPVPKPVMPELDKPEWLRDQDSIQNGSAMKRNHNTPIFRVPQMRHSPVPYGQIAGWETGGISASMGQASMPGLMGIESGSLWLHQSVGAITFAMSAEAIKYGYFRGLETQYGLSGSLTYDINERFGITLFGSYYTAPHGFMTPATIGYMAIPSFGGFTDWRINDRWGVKVGAQSYRSSITRQWEIQPMVIPYFRLNRKTELGIDVGGILYNLVKAYSGRNTIHINNPTIPPPGH